MLKAMESGSPMVSLFLLNPIAGGSGRSYHVLHKMIRLTTYNEYNHLLIPYIVLSKGLQGIDFHYDVTCMEPMIHKMVLTIEKPVIHIVFSLQDCSYDGLECDTSGQY